MKRIAFIIIALSSIGLFGQDGKSSSKSEVKHISLKKEVNIVSLRKLPDLLIYDKNFIDDNKNNIINVNENCQVSFKLENKGQGEAKNVIVKFNQIAVGFKGLQISDSIILGTINAGQVKDIVFPIKTNMDLADGKALFRIEVLEENGFDAMPFELEIDALGFKPPKIVVADAVFSTDDGGKIKPAYPVNLKVLVQNIGEGEAQNVMATFIFIQQNCLMLSESDKFEVGTLLRGETKEINFQFTTNRRYTYQEIPIKVLLTESYKKYAEDKLLSVGLEQDLKSTEQVTILAKHSEQTNISMASLVAETDKNIPVSPEKFPFRYALVIGNEDYTKFQSGLNTESNVAFARNDAQIFAEYAQKTFGVKNENMFLLNDATAAEMLQNIELVSKLMEKTGTKAELLFYYAGHGLPDEATKIPYLIPVDVSGSNPKAGISLAEIYNKFANTGAKRITVFLDACFTGGGREAGLIAARGVKVKPKVEAIQGNMVVFAATKDEQSALPFHEKRHGMFTYFLLKKIQDSKGLVTYEELGNYVQQNVALQSLKINRKEQDPQVIVSYNVLETWKIWTIK